MSSSNQTSASTKQSIPIKDPSAAPSQAKANGTASPTASMTLPASTTYSAEERLFNLRAQASGRDESYYRGRVTATNTLAEAIFYAKYGSIDEARGNIARGISTDELITSLAVQLTLTTQLLETRRVRKDIALRAIAKRRDGFSDGDMQEVWDEAWDEVHKEEDDRRKKAQEVREAKKAARAQQWQDNKPQNKNGSAKVKARKAQLAAEGLIVKGGAGNGKDSYRNGGVSCTKKEFLVGGSKKDGEEKKK